MTALRISLSRSTSVLLVILAAMVVSLLAVSPVSAAGVSHTYTGTFGATSSTPADPYPLSGPTDVAVDQSSADFYVTDPGNHRVEKFSPSGSFLLMFGKGVDQTSGANVCTASSNDTCQAGASGSSPAAFEDPYYLAVDNSNGPSSGDIYVADKESDLVQKFESSGRIVSSWGIAGQKDGSDATNLPGFGPPFGLAVSSATGELYVGGTHYASCCGAINVWHYTQNGTYIEYGNTSGASWLKVDPEGSEYFGDGNEVFKSNEEIGIKQMTSATPATGFDFDPSSHELYQDTGSVVDHFSGACNPIAAPCDPLDSFGSGDLFGSKGVGVDGTSHTVYVANSTANDVAAFGDARPIVTTGPPTSATQSSVTLTAQIDPAGRGNITACHFEYGFDKSYGTSVPCSPDPASNPPGSNFSVPTEVTATVSGLSPGTKDHYRVVASNTAGGTAAGLDQTFITTQPPAIDGLASANLTATSADLRAQVNPNGLETSYRFEYGPTLEYGETAPVPEGTIAASNSDSSIAVHLEGLTPHVVYHYRLLATNSDGTTTTEDQTFNFFPPSCPNSNVRQQAQANYLPDCRAYELVSPGDAAGTQLYPDGPNTGHAISPSRFAFTGLWGTIPGSGGSPINSVGDLYVATRTDTGWVTKYVGPAANEVAIAGGPPQGLPDTGNTAFQGERQSMSNGGSTPDIIQNNVLTNPSMSEFLDWNDGNQSAGSSFGADTSNPTPIASAAPYVWTSENKYLGRWPTNLETVPTGQYPTGWNMYTRVDYVQPGDEPLADAPGGMGALNCPGISPDGNNIISNFCPGDVQASSDLSHFVFASEWNVFAPGGQLSSPGSVYDNDTKQNSVVVASKTPGGADIPSEPGDASGDPLEIPAVSSDGSHILMAAGGTGPCGLANCSQPPCASGVALRCPMQPSRLYMRVDDAVSYDVSEGHDVHYVGMTSDGSKVYFTTPEQLTSEDTDSSTDLYMWSEKTNALTLISKGINGSGNGDSCNASFTVACGVVTYSNLGYCQLESGIGGNCRSDSFIASNNGDIYFFSPELLDGSRGIPNQENLYVYRDGQVQYVTTLTTGPYCTNSETYGGACSDGPAVRMQVTPSDSFAAFITASQVTQYENAGHLEMYRYNPATRDLVCVSCIPSGESPTSNVEGSQDGLFLTEDGRAFFSTEDALVHGDTNHALDVYEYTEGHAQLITPGTGQTEQSSGIYEFNVPGLVGVSADGTDVYFSTYDTLLSQDHNGLFLKFYDARSGGGFSNPAPPPPCDAADECHGAGSTPPALPQITGNGKPSSSGNVRKSAHRRHTAHKRHRRRRARHKERAGRYRHRAKRGPQPIERKGE